MPSARAHMEELLFPNTRSERLGSHKCTKGTPPKNVATSHQALPIIVSHRLHHYTGDQTFNT